MKTFAKHAIAFLMAASLSWSPWITLAQTEQELDEGFRPEAILDDRDIFDLGNWDRARVQSFLSSKGTLGSYRSTDIDGQVKLASDIIWRVAASYKVNPKYLLALMQKEQSLVEDPNPSQKQFDWATGYGVCDSCSKDDPSIQDFKGFANQLEWAAKQHREKYLLQILGRGTTIAGYAPGKLATIDGRKITPANRATAMLYSYTPHIHGNLNLWRIWQRWFSLSFPDGTIVKGKTSNKIYLIRFGEKRRFTSRAVAYSMVPQEKIVTVEDSQLASYADGKPIAFANYSLVETPNGKRFLLVGDEKRHILNMSAFRKLGFNEDEIVEAEPADLEGYADGPDLTTNSAYPTGLLAKDGKGNYFYIESGVRHPIPHKAFLSLYFKGQPAKLLTQSKLESFKTGEPYRLRDGELVQGNNSPAVYVITNGKRRPISSGSIFEELGWNWKNVVKLPEKLLASYTIGDPVDGRASSVQLAVEDTEL
jgi:hypothetical protein